MNVRKIIEKYLRENRYDGLEDPQLGCRCRTDILFIFCNMKDRCKPYKESYTLTEKPE